MLRAALYPAIICNRVLFIQLYTVIDANTRPMLFDWDFDTITLTGR